MEVIEMPSSYRSNYGLNAGTIFECTACGENITVEPTVRVYRPGDCRHPVLRSLTEWICSRCYNWDYDELGRQRDTRRKPLTLKDGRRLTREGVLPPENEDKDEDKNQSKLF